MTGEMLSAYLSQLTPMEQKVLHIAASHLETSFSLVKSIGFQEWQEKQQAQVPKAQEPKAQEPKAQEPKAQEPKAQEPKEEAPKEEPKAPKKIRISKKLLAL